MTVSLLTIRSMGMPMMRAELGGVHGGERGFDHGSEFWNKGKAMTSFNFLLGFVCIPLIAASCATTTTPTIDPAQAARARAAITITTKEAKEAAAKHSRLSSSHVRTKIRNGLKDPSAALFKTVKRQGLISFNPKLDFTGSYSPTPERVLKNGTYYKGLVGELWSANLNGKNSYGGYTGYKTSYYLNVYAVKSGPLGFIILRTPVWRSADTYAEFLDQYNMGVHD